MTVWNVWYDDWQMECCGMPFSVGDEVAWQLRLRDVEEFGRRRDWLPYVSVVEGEQEADRDPGPGEYSGEGRRPVVVSTADGLAASWLAPVPVSAVVRAEGILSVEHHGGKWPGTQGRVRSVDVVSREYRETAPGSRTYEAVPGTLTTRGVEACPKWFTGSDPALRQDGVLVTLEVPGAGSARRRGE